MKKFKYLNLSKKILSISQMLLAKYMLLFCEERGNLLELWKNEKNINFQWIFYRIYINFNKEMNIKTLCMLHFFK